MNRYVDEETPERPSSRLRKPIAWLGWALLFLVLLVADPLDIHPIDTWLHHLLGHHEEHGAGGGPESTQLWTCPMHPQILEDGPGTCPICGMDLVPVKGSAAAPAAAASGAAPDRAKEGKQLWTCGMHPQVIQEEPGICPICHMELTPLRTRTASPGERKILFYRNPMNPEITSPVAAKDQMGMDYVPVYSDEAGAAMVGGATVTIDPAVVQNMNVTTATVEKRDMHRQIRTVGYLDYDQERMVSVTTKYSGFIEKTFVNYLGQPVSKGQPLFEVYSPELVQTQQELLSALSYVKQLAGASAETRARAEGLLDAARRRLAFWDISPGQIARLEQTGEVFRTLTVAAPAGGVVMKRMEALEGMAARPGMELLHIADLSALWLRVEVFEDQLPWVNVGSSATVGLNYFPGEPFSGTVRYVEPSVAEKTRTVGLTLEVPNPSGRLRPGMYATVELAPVVARDAITVPTNAVIRTGERNVAVVALGNGRFAPREVKLGPSGNGFTQVLEGIEAGEEVVTSAQFLIDSESNLQAAIQKLIASRHEGR